MITTTVKRILSEKGNRFHKSWIRFFSKKRFNIEKYDQMQKCPERSDEFLREGFWEKVALANSKDQGSYTRNSFLYIIRTFAVRGT